MAVSTDKILPGVLPPKEETEGVDFLAVLDNLNPSVLSHHQLEQFKPRAPFETGYGMGNPVEPISHRLSLAKIREKMDREELIKKVGKYKDGTTRSSTYQSIRKTLVKAIGSKVVAYIVQQEYDSMSPEERKKSQDEYFEWRDAVERQRAEEEEMLEKLQRDFENGDIEANNPLMQEVLYGHRIPYGFMPNPNYRIDKEYISVLAVKVTMVRKKLKIRQRDFAKVIGVNINKYGDYERGNIDLEDLHFLPYEFIKRVVDATYANPYWLENENEYTVDADEEWTAKTVEEAQNDEPYAMFVEASVIRYWWSRKLMK